MTKTIRNIYLTTTLFILTWLLFSYLEIITKNTTTCIYSNYNLIVVLFKTFNNILLGGIF